MKHGAEALRVALALLVVALFGAPAFAQAVPPRELQDILVKTSLMTFNDANTTGNYDVFHARGAKPFRDQFPPAKLAETFKAFRDQHIYLDFLVAKTPIPSEEAKVDANGRLMLKGYFDTSPSRLYYDLAFIMSDDEWKLIKLNVDLKKPDK